MLAVLLLAVLISACGTNNSGVLEVPERDASESFAVSTIDGVGTYSPALSVVETDAEVAVTVSAENAEELSGAFFHLYYDGSEYSPDSVDYGDLLGENVVTLSLTDVASYVPVGVMQIVAKSVPASGNGELATVTFAKTPFTGTRGISATPSGAANTVDDLAIIAQTDTTATLRWTEKNAGDYNNDSLVGVSDLTPIGINFDSQVSASADPLKVGLCDGNSDDFITVGDITTIGQNFGNMLSGYKLYKDADGSNPYSDGISAARDAFDDDLNHPLIYTFEASRSPGFVAYTVRPVTADDLANPGPVSNVAELKDDPGAPEPPTEVVAESNASTGHQTVKVTWTASTSTDVASYIISRKLATDADWGEPVDLGIQSSYTDEDDTFVEEPYVYRLYAKDYSGALSTYALSNEVTPYFVEGPDAPTDVVAIQDCGTTDAILIEWTPPADDTGVIGFQIYRKGPGESEFSELVYKSKYEEEHLDLGLTQGEYYEYYLVTKGTEADSDPSATVGAYPCEFTPEINITDLTTDKLTHCDDGSEAVANLSVTTDNTPDSVDWNATAGEITGTGSNVTWAPTAGIALDTVTVTCTVHLGTASDSGELTLYVTEEPIKTKGLLSQDIGDPLGSGHLIDFDNIDLMEPLEDGGNVIYADPTGRPLSYYVNEDHVNIHTYFRTG